MVNFARLAFKGVLYTCIGIVTAELLFSREASIVAIMFLAFLAAPALEALLVANRDAIWAGTTRPMRANFELARDVFGLFVGVVVAYVGWALLLPEGAVIEVFPHQIGQYGSLHLANFAHGGLTGAIQRNAYLFGLFFGVGLLYQASGFVLSVGWTASTVGVLLAWLPRAETMQVSNTAALTAKTMFAMSPHLALDAVGFILAGMCGVFFRRAWQKYGLGTEKFRQVGRAVVVLLVVGVVILLVGSAVESVVLPRVHGWLV